jgi:hypothetical protein
MEKGFLDTLIGVAASPTSTIRSVCQQRPIGWAMIVLLAISLVTLVTFIAMLQVLLERLGLPGLGLAMPAILPVLMICSIIYIVMLVIITAIYHVVALLLGGSGSYWGLFCGFAFAILPYIIAAPLKVIELIPMVGALLFPGGILAIWGWSLMLHILAVRENYLVPTGRAILIFLMSLMSLVVLMVLGLLVMFPVY